MVRSILAWLRWRGRLRRSTFFWMLLGSALAFTVLYVFIDGLNHTASLILYPPAFAVWLSLAVRRLHDQARGGAWLLALVVPILGPLLVGWLLLFRAGTEGGNQFGDDPRTRGRDYLTVRIHECA